MCIEVKYIVTMTKYFATAIGSSLLTVGICWFLWGSKDGSPADRPSVVSVPLSTTSTLQATQKTSQNQPDLEVSQKYTAVINGEKVEVPVVHAATGSTPPASTGATGTSASLKQELDVSPLVNRMVPKWELGVGVGKQKGDSGLYLPLSLQRNYAFDKAIQFELHVDPSDRKINGVELQHKWRF